MHGCRANLLLEETQPWTALKKGSEEEKAAAGATLVTALEGARIAAVLLAPVTPGVSRRVYEQLGLAGELEVRCAPWLQGGAATRCTLRVFQYMSPLSKRATSCSTCATRRREFRNPEKEQMYPKWMRMIHELPLRARTPCKLGERASH